MPMSAATRSTTSLITILPSGVTLASIFLRPSNNFSNSIVNNAIWSMTNLGLSTSSLSFEPVGIKLLGGAGQKVYFNSVNMFGAKSFASNSAALSVENMSMSGLDLRDNVLVNNITGPAGSKAYSVWVANSPRSAPRPASASARSTTTTTTRRAPAG